MSLFVKVENEEVTQVWDTQPSCGRIWLAVSR